MSQSGGRPIGTARMAQDGTLVLDLRAEGPRGELGLARILRGPTHPRYQAWIDHLGGMAPGDEKIVPPWPDPPQAAAS